MDQHPPCVASDQTDNTDQAEQQRTAQLESLQGHGMAGELVHRDWATLTLSDVNDLARDYPQFGSTDRSTDASLKILWHSPRPFSSAALLATAEGQFFIKRTYHSFRNRQDIQQEHDFMAHLEQKGIAVAQLLHNRHAQTVTQLGEWVYEIHHALQGVDLYADIHSWQAFFYPQHAYAAGQMMAQLHHAAIDYDCGPRASHYLLGNQRLLDQPDLIAAIQSRIASDPCLKLFMLQRLAKTDDQAEFEVFLKRIQHQHLQLYPNLHSLIRLWTHNDLHSSNMFWSNRSATAQVSAVIDFGLSDQTSMLYDFAVAIERNCIAWLDLTVSDAGADPADGKTPSDIKIDWDSVTQLIRGYLAAGGRYDQIQHVAQMLPLVHIDFALYELVYFIEITQNTQHAEAAYRYLIDHTAWFCGKQGQDFLVALAQMLEQSMAINTNI